MKVLVFKDIKNQRWTIWSLDRKKHIGYADSIVLQNCEFVVKEDKRKKVLSSGKRFPHAWVVGEISKLSHKGKNQVIYNPFKNKSFMKGNRSIKKSAKVCFNKEGKVFV